MKKNSTQLPYGTGLYRLVASGKNSLNPLSILLLALMTVAGMGKLQAQYSGTISVPNATFANLGVLIDSLNQYGLGGNLTVNSYGNAVR